MSAATIFGVFFPSLLVINVFFFIALIVLHRETVIQGNPSHLLGMKILPSVVPCFTLLGDTMLANLGKDYSAEYLRNSSESFDAIRHKLGKCQTVIANLEGPITNLGLQADPLQARPAYSFNMDPNVVPQILMDEGITHVNRANNHLLDRGEDGVQDTDRYLKQSGMPYFGCGRSTEEAAEPLILNMSGISIGITGYSDLYDRGVLPDPIEEWTGVLPVTIEHVGVGRRALDEHGVDLRVAFVHWGDNYGKVSIDMIKQAHILSDIGLYDLIIGSDGSHVVQKFDVAGERETPVLFNVGNFIFHTPGRFSSAHALPYGAIVHVQFDPVIRRFVSIELHCTHVDNHIVKFQPQECTPLQARELFASMGEYVIHHSNTTFATIKLRLQ